MIMLIIVVSSMFANTLAMLLLGFLLVIAYSKLLLKCGIKSILMGSLVLLPFVIILFLTWVAIVGAPPAGKLTADINGAITYCSIISLRIWIIFISIYSLSNQMINSGLVSNLSALPLPFNVKVLIISSLTTLTDLKQHFKASHDAMLARGIIRRSSWLSQAKQLGPLLKVVLITGIKTALSRAELWQQRGYLNKLNTSAEDKVEGIQLYLTLPYLLWLGVAIYYRVSFS